MKINKIKIASGEIINLPFLKYVGKQNKFTILSTGMANMYEIKNAIKILTKNGLERKNCMYYIVQLLIQQNIKMLI